LTKELGEASGVSDKFVKFFALAVLAPPFRKGGIKRRLLGKNVFNQINPGSPAGRQAAGVYPVLRYGAGMTDFAASRLLPKGNKCDKVKTI
jgi:hypothetical protein